MGKWIGYQILFGAGIGMGMQQTIVAAHYLLDLADVPTGTCSEWSSLIYLASPGLL